MPDNDQYEIVVGLEVHAQLLTKSKLFCGDSTLFGAEPNTQISAISLGYPGTLPRMNEEVIGHAIKLGLACHCTIVRENYFARKNYFYPDLPKGYQISQHTTPICRNGHLEVMVGTATKKIRINRIHMEEDAGKSLHGSDDGFSQIDYNRAGMPLLEIVTEPDIRSAEEAYAYVSSLRKLVRHLGVCDGNMEQGSLRCDVNISVRRKGDEKLGTKVEIKNLNSIRFIKKVIETESARLINLHRDGTVILQQTRGLNENDFSTYAIRTKEDEDDYRYFPEPDLPPFFITEAQIKKIEAAMPPSQLEVAEQLSSQFPISVTDARQLAEDEELLQFFNELVKYTAYTKQATNWTIGPIKQYLLAHELSLEESNISLSSIAEMIELVESQSINHGTALQKIFPALAAEPGLNIKKFVTDNDLAIQRSEGALDEWIDLALSRHADKIPAYQKGKKGLISVFVGEVMKQSKGKADAKLITEKLPKN